MGIFIFLGYRFFFRFRMSCTFRDTFWKFTLFRGFFFLEVVFWFRRFRFFLFFLGGKLVWVLLGVGVFGVRCRGCFREVVGVFDV